MPRNEFKRDNNEKNTKQMLCTKRRVCLLEELNTELYNHFHPSYLAINPVHFRNSSQLANIVKIGSLDQQELQSNSDT